MSTINVQIISNKKSIKNLNETINFDTSSLKDYVSVLRTIQKAVNVALTEVVDKEKSNESITDECLGDDDDDEDSDVDEKPNSTAKRKLTTHKHSKKMKL